VSGLLLLDVNVLLALGWTEHEHHELVLKRLHAEQRWASSAITQLGFIRISSTPGIFSQALSPASAASVLAQLLADPLHAYLTERAPPVALDWQNVQGCKQTTDLFLLRLAAERNAKLLTMDRRLAASFPTAALELLRFDQREE